MGQATDARGVDVVEGATCIYGAPVGRSIAMAEGVIDGFTPSGRVWVRVVRRSYGGGTAERVHVGADRLVIVDVLPQATTLTQMEEREAQRLHSIASNLRRIAELEAGAEPRSTYDTVEQRRQWLAELESK